MNEIRHGIIRMETMSNKEFYRLSKFIHAECGIKMPASKKTMLEARLQKRLRNLGLKSFDIYCDYLFSPEGIKRELVCLIDVITTNKTDFFREPRHFDFMVQTVLPKLIKDYGAGIKKKLMIWSAGCATGEEPYTLGMVLSEFAERYPVLGFNYLIIATDISTRAIEEAKNGVYKEDRVKLIHMALKKKYFLRNKDKNKGLVRIVPELRELVKFRMLNFMDDDFRMREPMDIIFCRNVFIYFNRDTQEKLLNRFCRYLTNGGYIFVGHSETLSGLNVPLVRVAPTVYRKPVESLSPKKLAAIE